MFEDVAELGAVQLGVRRHRGETRVPDAEQDFHIFGTVARDDGDAVTGLQG